MDQLPFAVATKEDAPRGKRDGYLKQREDASTGLAPRESTEARRTRKLVHQLETVRAEKKRIKGAAKEKKGERAKELAKIDASRRASSKLKNKAAHRAARPRPGAEAGEVHGGRQSGKAISVSI